MIPNKLRRRMDEHSVKFSRVIKYKEEPNKDEKHNN